MQKPEGREEAAFLLQFDAPSAIFANVVAHILAVVPVALYVLVAPSLMTTFAVGTGSIGAMLSVGMAMSSVTALVVGSNAYRLNLRTTAILGVLIHVVGNVVGLFAGAWTGIMMARAISAVGDAMVLSSANAVLSRSQNNTRYWAMSSVATGLGTSIGTYALGRTLAGFGPDIFFASMIVLGLLSLPVLWLLPPFTMPDGERAKRSGSFGKRLFNSMGSGKGLAILIGAMLFCMGNSAIFNFSAIIGREIGISIAQIGLAQSISYIVGTAVNFIIIFVAARFGRAKPMILLTAVFAVSSIVMGLSSSFFAYAAAVIGMAAAFRGTNPYVYGICARHDPAGGVAASLIVFIGVGSSLGPSLTPLMLGNSNDYTFVGFAAAGLFVVGAGILAAVAMTQEHRSPSMARETDPPTVSR